MPILFTCENGENGKQWNQVQVKVNTYAGATQVGKCTLNQMMQISLRLIDTHVTGNAYQHLQLDPLYMYMHYCHVVHGNCIHRVGRYKMRKHVTPTRTTRRCNAKSQNIPTTQTATTLCDFDVNNLDFIDFSGLCELTTLPPLHTYEFPTQDRLKRQNQDNMQRNTKPRKKKKQSRTGDTVAIAYNMTSWELFIKFHKNELDLLDMKQ